MERHGRRVLALFALFAVLLSLVPSPRVFVMAKKTGAASETTLEEQVQEFADMILEDLAGEEEPEEPKEEPEDPKEEPGEEPGASERVKEKPQVPEEKPESGLTPEEETPLAELELSEAEEEEPAEEEPEEKPAEEEPEEEPVEEEPAEEPAEEEPEEEPAEEEPEFKVTYKAEAPGFEVSAVTGSKAFGVPVTLTVEPLSENDDAYREAAAALAESGRKYAGMIALDIRFEDEEHNEVEPDGDVLVSIRAKKAAIKAAGDTSLLIPETLEVVHVFADADGRVTAETVADFAGAADGTVAVTAARSSRGTRVEQISSSFTVNGFSTYVITWENEGVEQSATIHWGSYEEGSFTEFDSTTAIDNGASSADLAIKVDGYYYTSAEYKETEDGEPVNMADSVIRKVDGVWTLTTSTEAEDGTVTTATATIADGSHIYVNYAPKGSGGYSPPPAPQSSVEGITPDTEKQVEDNGDGTYTIRLDIVGHEDSSVEKVGANVIVVMDITQSMTNGMPGGGSRMAAAKSALNALIDTLNPGTGTNQNLIYFAAVNFGDNRNYYDGCDWTTSRSDMEAYVTGLPNNPNDFGTCWQAGLRGGYNLADEARTDADMSKNATYVLFVTDGNPNCYANNNDGTGTWHASTGPGYNADAYNAAVYWANRVAGISNFYGIFCGDADGLTHLTDLVNNANGAGVINGNTVENIENAFKDIAQTIVSNLGASNVTVDDGIPSLSNVSANVTAGEAGGYEYYITPAGGEEQRWTGPIDGVIDVGPPGAGYDQSNGVTWDLGEVGTLKEGWTYTIKFKVWPSQEAYDTIADLNNGLITMTDDELAAAGIGKNPDGTYYLLTNTHLLTTFTDPAGNIYEEVEEDVVSEAMALPTKSISVEKIWNNYLDQQNPPAGVKLILTKDGDDYLYGDNAIEVSSATNWRRDDIYISLGQITQDDDGYNVIETGHDYEVVELEEFDGSYRWELTSEVYHPMVINGTATMLILDEDATGTDGTDYYTINGKKYVVPADGSNYLTAWNDRRSWLQLEKIVTGEDAPADALFEFTVTVTDANGDDVWFSAYGPDGIVKDLETSATPESGNTGYFFAASGSAITIKIKAGWTVRFLNLPSGTTYTLEETSLPDGFHFVKAESHTVVDTDAEQDDPEDPEISGKTVSGTINVPNTEFYVDYTNEYAETEVTVTKVWDDEEDKEGIRPESVSVQLLAGGEAYGDPVTLDEDGEWTYTWEELPVWIDDEEVEYDVEEVTTDVITGTDGPGTYAFKVEGDAEKGFTVTNTHTPIMTTVTVTKEWDDEDDKEGFRPESVSIQLLADDEAYGDPVTLDESGEWTYTWEDLPVYKGTDEIEYDVEEVTTDVITGTDGTGTYAIKVEGDAEEGFTVTNTHTPEETTVTVTKKWDDEDDKEGFRPESVSIQLLAGGEAYGDPVTLDESGEWTYTWEKLPKYADAKAIEYDVEEVKTDVITGTDGTGTYAIKVEGDAEEGFTVTNTHTPEETTVTVTKKWDDGEDADGIRPESVEVQLLAGGEPSGDPVTLNERGEWTYTWEKLPKYADAKAIEYSVEEVTTDVITGTDGPGTYAFKVEGDAEEGFTVTNTHTPEETTVTVTKEWDDDDDAEGRRPESIEVQLYADGKASGDPVTLSEDNDWTYTWEKLTKYAGGDEIEYTVDETEVPDGYEKEVSGSAEDGFTITNSYTPEEKIRIKVKKVWKDKDDKDGIRPASVSVQLYADGEPYGDPVKLSEKNSWTYTWKDLPKTVDGKEVTYTVDEVSVPEGYTKKVSGSAKKGFTITNTHQVKPPVPPVPPTGDSALHPVFWGTLSMIAALGLILLTFFRKKEDEM